MREVVQQNQETRSFPGGSSGIGQMDSLWLSASSGIRDSKCVIHVVHSIAV